MLKYTVCVLLIATLVAAHDQTKKPRRSRRPKNEEDTTLQPSVISYSTFGFNDVGSCDGFVPTSPDYVNYLNNQESSTRLYAPAFPSAPDATDFNSEFGQYEGYSNNDDGAPEPSMLQYPQSSVNFFSTPTFENNDSRNKNMASSEAIRHAEELSGPIYGTKISSKNKPSRPSNTNNTEFHVYSSGPVFNSNELLGRFKQQETDTAHESKLSNGESTHSDKNIPSYVPQYPSSEMEDFVKAQTNPQNAIKFPRVVDFTKVKQYYPSELDDKYQVSTYSSILHQQNDNLFPNSNGNQNNQFVSPTQTVKEPTSYNTKLVDVNEDNDKENIKTNMFSNSDYSSNYIKPASFKTSHKNSIFNSDYNKDNYKHKWTSENANDGSKVLSNPFKGYEYSTDYSNTSFKYEYTPDRKPFRINTDEPTPASSNIDLTSYHASDTDYSNFKKIPDINIPFDDDYDPQSNRDKFKSDEFLNQFKNLYTTTPSLKWNSGLKSPEFTFSKNHVKRPQYEDSGNHDMVHIPKRPSNSFKYNYGYNYDGKINDYPKQRPYKSNKYEKPRDWNKDVHGTRFKSEEDLLDLRNHDTSHPSYLPSHRPNNNDLVDDTDYKKLVEKWRQSYLKSKYREAYRDYESYASEEKPIHVPIPKPYPIEVPHPVIVPVPQPYPVRVPIPKPVAVPVVRELNVPIEKPVPYPVIKKVPYPVEKLVLVPVEKEVKVPVIKPYPVHVPHVRPVFHHSRPPREEFEAEAEDDDYLPRPESSKKTPPYKKRPKSTHSRQRRPTRVSYHDRSTSRRRWPTSQRPSESRRRPSSKEYHAPYRHHDYETEREYDREHSDYYYCKRTGNC